VKSPKTSFDILLVEDDPGDAGLVKIAIRKSQRPHTVHHVKNGMDAMAFLRRIGPANLDAPRPDLIFMDLNLPGRSGHEILQEIKADPQLQSIPVVVLSTSEASRDVTRSYALGANSFITKPMEMERFSDTLVAVLDYWFGVVQLPG
jgi:CheY-like chemotaxis protein